MGQMKKIQKTQYKKLIGGAIGIFLLAAGILYAWSSSEHVSMSEDMSALEEISMSENINISPGVIIKDNIAVDGGGIYTADASYQNLTVGEDVVFIDNYATAGWWIYDRTNPPEDTIEHIETRSMSTIDDLPVDFAIDLRHPLNNNDINYRTNYTITIIYKVRSGNELVPLQISDENGNLTNKANVYEQIAVPLRYYEPAESLVHIDTSNTFRFTSWIDGVDGDEIEYKENEFATRPIIHYIHTDRTLTLIYCVLGECEEITRPRPPIRPGSPIRPDLPGRPNLPNRPGTSNNSNTANRPTPSGGSGTQSQITSPGNSDAESDYGNYEFIKFPNVKRVRPGQVVTYTFAEFGNNWGVPLERFTIMDKPDRGLDIISVSLPAFTRGEGVFYSIYYYTELGGTRQKTLAKNIPANRPFSTQLPELRSGDHITLLSIEFGAVPAGFAVGDTITLEFRVWDRPPARQLVNTGILSYGIDGRYREFVTDSFTGTVFLGGWFGSPLTGDVGWIEWYMLANVSLFLMIFLSVVQSRQKRKYRNL